MGIPHQTIALTFVPSQFEQRFGNQLIVLDSKIKQIHLSVNPLHSHNAGVVGVVPRPVDLSIVRNSGDYLESFPSIFLFLSSPAAFQVPIVFAPISRAQSNLNRYFDYFHHLQVGLLSLWGIGANQCSVWWIVFCLIVFLGWCGGEPLEGETWPFQSLGEDHVVKVGGLLFPVFILFVDDDLFLHVQFLWVWTYLHSGSWDMKY